MAVSRNKQPAELQARFAQRLGALLPPGADLAIGLSGGRDSIILLHLCHTLLPEGRLGAIHVHHGLSPNADHWADFCQEQCRSRGIPLSIQRVQVGTQQGKGLEAAARQARYQAFRQAGAQRVALAHHRRDQAETLLFNLCRGAGVAGAAAMPWQRESGGLVLLRPLLDWSSEEMAVYAFSQELAWIEDESNWDERFSRNFLRHRILPSLETHFPSVEASLARATAHFAEARELLEELAAQDYERVQGQLAQLRLLSHARQANWLRYWLTQNGWRPPEAATLQEALRQLATLAQDSGFAWELEEGIVHLWRGQLYLVPQVPGVPDHCCWSGEAPLAWGGRPLSMEPVLGRGLDATRLQGRQLEVRRRSGGERLSLGPGRPERPLKKILQESHVPPWVRWQLPLLFVDGELVACPGVGVAAGWQAAPGTAGYLPVWAGLSFGS